MGVGFVVCCSLGIRKRGLDRFVEGPRISRGWGMVQGRLPDLVVCSLESWDDVWRRNQFLVRELLALDPALRVLFVEPAVDVLHRGSRRQRRRRGLHPVAGWERLWRLAPLKVMPRIAGPFADRSLARQVLRAVAELGFSRPRLWVNDSNYASLLRTVQWPTVYDITDDWLLLESTSRRQLSRLRRHDEALLRHADAVVVCSDGLARSRETVRPVALIPNGVDVDHFRLTRRRPPDLPPSPTAVYVGTLHHDRLDVDLCLELSTTLAVELVLVGPNSLAPTATSRLSAQPNVHLLGERSYQDVPAYLQHADVIVVPHRVSPFTESLDPIKAYECLAVDTPTVATPVAGFRDHGDDFVVARRDQFCAAVRAVMSEPRRARTATPPSWRQRAEQFAQVLEAPGRATSRN